MKLLTLLIAFFRIGIFGYGGGLAMLPLIYQSVQQFGFMTAEEFSDLLALSQVTPGAIAVNAATYVGLKYAGLPGAAAATLGEIIPAFCLVLIVCRFLDRFHENPLVKGAFYGIRPVTVGLIGAAVLFVSKGVLVHGSLLQGPLRQGHLSMEALFSPAAGYFDVLAIGMAAASVLLMTVFKMKPIPAMLIMAAAGAVAGGVGVLGA